MQTLTWDTGILAALGLLLAYSLLIHRHKALAALISTYIAYMVVSTWGMRLADLFKGERTLIGGIWINAKIDPSLMQALFMVAVVVVLTIFLKLGGKRSRYSAGEVVAYSVATIALLVLFGTLFMEPATRQTVLSQSALIPLIYTWREWVLGVPVLLMIVFGIYGSEE